MKLEVFCVSVRTLYTGWLWTVVVSADSVDSMKNIFGFVLCFCFPQIFLQMFFQCDFKESQLQAC